MRKENTSTHVKVKYDNKPKKQWKKALGASAAIAIPVSTLAVLSTTANWSDAESAGDDFSSGHFDIEISVDDGQTWHTNTANNGEVELPISTLFEENVSWGSSETRASSVALRIPDTTTHLGVFELEDWLSLTSSGNADDYSWELYDHQHKDNSECQPNGFVSSGENNASHYLLNHGASLDEVSLGSGDSWQARYLGPHYGIVRQEDALPMEEEFYDITYHDGGGGNIEYTGDRLDLCLEVSSKNNINAEDLTEATWTFNATQQTVEDFSYAVALGGSHTDEVGTAIQSDNPFEFIGGVFEVLRLAKGDLDITQSIVEEARAGNPVPSGFEWNIPAMVEFDISIQPFSEAEYADQLRIVIADTVNDYNSRQWYYNGMGIDSPAEILYATRSSEEFVIALSDRLDVELPE